MKIAVLGTGMVGRALAGRLAELGHDVAVGTRDVADTRRAADYAALRTTPRGRASRSRPRFPTPAS
ncbi:NAD(P)-binding domain-containing protein [Subtercola sp. Z020]|uniref:NAD(P)-binding domain-containing protein n=1 Tax=Subtercola sp. Z020 TaxID=2080582 RepID=UPI001E619BA2|nr:NAD(P)-binding domain-containing protein [Subtercola sp. Z020]